MKFQLILDKNSEEKVIVYAKEKSPLTDKIYNLVCTENSQLIGYINSQTVIIDVSDVYCFYIENNRVFVSTQHNKYQLKERLYQLEKKLGEDFIRINQSCIISKRGIKRFDAKISGTLKVILKNGYEDYVSRRNIKTVKERLGL